MFRLAQRVTDFFIVRKKSLLLAVAIQRSKRLFSLTNFASKVTLVHRRSELRAEKILQQRLFNHDKIEVVWDHVLDEVLGR